jgi:hypothetical protein
MKMAAFATAAVAVISAAQSPVAPGAAHLELTVGRFLETAAQYERTFRNLTVEETKVNEEFDQSGRTKRRREILADLLVYRPARSGAAGGTIEYRDVRLVDGKPVTRRSERALDLITRAPTRTSLAEELRLINKESQRYDFDRRFGPLTIGQIPRSTIVDDFAAHGNAAPAAFRSVPPAPTRRVAWQEAQSRSTWQLTQARMFRSASKAW